MKLCIQHIISIFSTTMAWQWLKRFWFYFLAFVYKNLTTTSWITFCVYLIMLSPHRLCGKFQFFVFRSIINIVSPIWCIALYIIMLFFMLVTNKSIIKTLDHLDKAHVFKPNNAFIFKTHGNVIYECWRIIKKLWKTWTTFMFFNQTMYSL